MQTMGRIFLSNRLAVVSLIFIVLTTLVGVFAPWIAPYPPNESHLDNSENVFAPSSSEFLLGTDKLGRDTFSRIIWGSRTSFTAVYVTTIGVLIIGLPIGILAGYYGGIIDMLLMRFVDIVLVIPPFFLILILGAMFGSSQGILILVMSLTFWPFIARLIRAEALSQRTRDYVLASKSIGATDFHIIFKHVVSNCIFPVIAGTALLMAEVILTEAALSYIGMGDPTLTSWGRMLSEAQTYMYSSWVLAIYPGIAITLVIFAFNIIGGGLNDALARGRR